MPVRTAAYVDAYHADNRVTNHGHTEFIILLNRALIIWYRKRQNIVEASTVSSDFIAAKACVEHITALRYKLLILGITVVESTKIHFDNEIVVNNFSILSSNMNKKHIYIAYYLLKWHIAAGIIKVS